MKTIYKPLSESDISSLIALMEQLGYKHTHDSLSNNIQAIRKSGGEVFVAEYANTICGCICAIIDVRLAEGAKGEIVSLIVSEDYRGRGLGKELVSTAERWLSNYVTEIRIRANEIRKNAHKFYKALGYQESKKQMLFIKNCQS